MVFKPRYIVILMGLFCSIVASDTLHFYSFFSVNVLARVDFWYDILGLWLGNYLLIRVLPVTISYMWLHRMKCWDSVLEEMHRSELQIRGIFIYWSLWDSFLVFPLKHMMWPLIWNALVKMRGKNICLYADSMKIILNYYKNSLLSRAMTDWYKTSLFSPTISYVSWGYIKT